MARQYSPRSFLRRTSNKLLARYFHGQGLLKDVAIDKLKETDVEPAFEAWMALPQEKVTRIDSDFRVVDVLADEQGVRVLIDEGGRHGLELIPEFDKLASFHDKALFALLKNRRVAEVAGLFREADHLPEGSWFRRREAVPTAEPRDDSEACAELGAAVGSYFWLQQGRGRECQVDAYKRGDSYYYFAFPEDYARAELEYRGSKLARRPHRPVFEIVFAYDPVAGILDTFLRGPKKTRQELETIFGRVILRQEIAPATAERVYNLNAFKQRGLKFSYEPAWGIEGIRVKMLRVFLLGGGGRRLTLEAADDHSREAIYDLLDAVFEQDAGGKTARISLALASVNRVGIEARFVPGSGRGKPTKTFYLGDPNSCTLGHDGRDDILRQMLIKSKIEPTKTDAGAADP